MNRLEYLRDHYAPDFERVQLKVLDYRLDYHELPADAEEVWLRIEDLMEPGELIWDREACVDTIYNVYQLMRICGELDARPQGRQISDADRETLELLCKYVSALHGYVMVVGV